MQLIQTSLLCLCFLLLSSSGALPVEYDVPCRIDSFQSKEFAVCEFDLRFYKLKLFWKRPNGEPYGSLQNIPRYETSINEPLAFAINAGMYHADRSPVGLFVENGLKQSNVETAGGMGNFYLKPNGIFYVHGDTAGILETGRFLREHPPADIATQSGPMLVIEGRIHPRFSPGSTSQKIRDGVGMLDSRKIAFVISNDPVSFNEFAKFFRDRLRCSNALYLDGSISSIFAPSLKRSDDGWPLGPIIGVYERKKTGK
jgi:uncharacterized protein YigE (DUF2233 family)